MTKDLASTEVCVRFFSVILLLVSHSYEGPQIGDEVEVSSDSVPIELHRGQWHDLMVPHFRWLIFRGILCICLFLFFQR